MTLKVKVRAIEHADTAWDLQPIAAIGSRITVVVDYWFEGDLAAGKFEVTHPGMDPKEFAVPARKPTGAWRPGGRATRSKDFTRVETMKCRVTMARVTTAPQPFTLVATEHCATEANDAVTMRVYADEGAMAAAMVLVRAWDGQSAPLTLARAGSVGSVSQHANTVRSYTRFYGQLFWKDPDGVERPFPKDMPVKLMLGEHPANAIDTTIGDDGKVTLEVIGYAEVIERKFLRMRFGAPTQNCVVCEAPGGTAAQVMGDAPAPTDPAGAYDRRFFSLPTQWTLREADWAVTADDGRWVAAKGHFLMTSEGRPASLGRKDAPVKLVLDPHWQYLKFEFFDRTYGHSAHDDERRTVPPMLLVADRSKPATATDFDEDVRSNWWLVADGATVQCVPWVLQRKPNGDSDARPSPDSILRFTNAPATCVLSSSATERRRVVATTDELKPGPERLRLYDLPTDWQSRNYYAELSRAPGEYGWYEDVAVKPTTPSKPLVFSLDDIVLTDEHLRRLAGWNHAERLAILAHTFDDTLPDCSAEGVYKRDAAATAPWYTTKPAAGAPEEIENYVVDHARWTRLIAAQGSLFDVFDKRTAPSAVFDPSYDVIGARAAVRWVDATQRLGTTTVWAKDVNGQWQADPTNAPGPGKLFHPSFPTRVDQPTFSIQPYYTQDYMTRFGKYLDVGSASNIGRFDMALLRCCGAAKVDGTPVEVAVNLWFHKISFNPAVAPKGMDIKAYQAAFVRNVSNRFNGADPKNTQKRAELLAKDPAKPIKVSVVTFMQVTPEAEAHYLITLTDSDKGARDWRSGQGTGETGNSAPRDSGTTNGFVNAHEHGHQSAFPDEYNERWDAASYGQASFFSTLPGDPYELDGRVKEFQEDNSPLMNGNHTLHNRYFWQAAEWVRLAAAVAMKVKLGETYADYWLPPYPTAQETKRHYAFWPLSPAKNDVALAARAPLTANRGKVDLYLYAVGADAFAVKTLPAREDPSGADPYDGILMVLLRLKVNAGGLRYQQDTDLKKLAETLALVVRRFDGPTPRKLNHVFCLKGTHGAGSPQEWKFKRCLVHFSPRLLISGVTELKTVAEWETDVGTFKNQTIWTDAKARLENYHAVEWGEPTKGAQLDTLIGPLAEPAFDIKGGFSVVHATTADITAALSTLAGLPADQVLDRFNAAQAVEDACNAWLQQGYTGVPNRTGAVTQLMARAKQGRDKLGALWFVRDLEAKAKDLKKRNTDQEATVTKVANVHAPHFTVNCKAGSPAKAEWDPLPLEGDLPTAAAWEALVPAAHRNGTVFSRLKGLLTGYKSKDRLDLAGRIKALGEIIGPATIATEPSPRGAWTDRGKPALAEIDRQLSVFESTDPANLDARQEAVVNAQSVAVVVDQLEHTDGTDVTAANLLIARTDATVLLIQFRRQVRAIEAHAAVFKAHLERWVTSTTVTLTGDSPADLEEMMLEAIPSMLGAYKAASKIDEKDVRALVSTLALDDLAVIDLLSDNAPMELPT
jgi:hypothetical protein